jgi:uncharacterized membrane protein
VTEDKDKSYVHTKSTTSKFWFDLRTTNTVEISKFDERFEKYFYEKFLSDNMAIGFEEQYEHDLLSTSYTPLAKNITGTEIAVIGTFIYFFIKFCRKIYHRCN